MPALPRPKDETLAQRLAKSNETMAQSYREAGFGGLDPATISRKCNQAHIQGRVAELREMRSKVIQRVVAQEMESSHAIAQKIGATKEKILSMLYWNAQRCLRGQPVLNEQGEQIPGRYTGRPDSAGFNQSIKLLGLEAHGMFVEKLEIGSPGDFSRMNDEEFEKAFQEEALAAGLPEDAVAVLLTYDGPKEPDESQNND